MKLGIVTIQKNRAQWLTEWVAFHYLVGFRNFYIYLHDCNDNSATLLNRLAHTYNIHIFFVPTETFRPQLVAYQHAYDNFSHDVDWLAFIDGDEFLFPTHCLDIRDVLVNFQYERVSAIGVYWRTFGSSDHIDEPAGLITENYRWCTDDDYPENSHIKSIVRSRQTVSVGPNAHIFITPWGTIDEKKRPVDQGWMRSYKPSYDSLRINHYVCQSFSFFNKIKKYSGAADAGRNMVREDDGFVRANKFSTHFDNSIDKYQAQLRVAVDEFGETFMHTKQYPPPSIVTPHNGPPTQIVADYQVVATIPPGDYKFTGNSVGQKDIVAYLFGDRNHQRQLLDIGFGVGDLGRRIKENKETQHWHIDGIEGFRDPCYNVKLFAKKFYRNIWHGLAQQLPSEKLSYYDALCLFDVIEHLDSSNAKSLLHNLFLGLGNNSYLVLSTPLWFWPQAHTNDGDLEEHLIGIPAASLFGMSPVMYFIDSQFLVGTFVFRKACHAYLDNFVPITDKDFDIDAGRRHLESLGRKADDILYFVR